MGGRGGVSPCPTRPKLAPSSRDSGSMASISSFGLTSPVDVEQSRPRESVEDVAVRTRRFKHHHLDDGDYVLTGREGKLERCEDEVSSAFASLLE